MEDHFSKKLRDLEITPSDRANALFQRRMEAAAAQHKGRKAFWYFATAATVMLALGFLFLLRFDATEVNTAIVVPESVEQEETAADTAESVVTDPAPETLTPPEVAPIKAPVPVRELVAEMPTGTKTSPAIESEERVAQNFPKVQKISSEINFKQQRVDLMNFALLDVHQGLELETIRPEPRIAVEEKTPSLLARVVREVKYVVNGDRPDWDRAGLKPAALVYAHNHNGFLANESRQVKEGIQRFKEALR